jgi:hypothetical protein
VESFASITGGKWWMPIEDGRFLPHKKRKRLMSKKPKEEDLTNGIWVCLDDEPIEDFLNRAASFILKEPV